ncbi:DUF1735 domain-containing protein [Puia dinghuensis]|uniref:BT-3987-like N-terminal domain-containing protein n=1 Tax=Puia dinghuensis TaxID=1792502 RepID=A0A8J2UIX2_9BACT|nr:DUF1735 domain-containing protein [Puia dinghuensis]GGB22507.1 hypothetical protein GCM10011511_53040 [Puia dinghuensis]
MKRISIVLPLFTAVLFSACLKDKPNVDLASTQGTYIAEISTASTSGTTDAPASGLAYFSAATLSFNGANDPDSVFFTVNIASDYAPTKNMSVTLGVDQTALTNYNASGPPTVFEMFPDSTFSFPTKTGTIKAGSRLDTFWVVFHPNKIDPTHSYMLPISITSAPGTTISGNMGTIYFHAIGNPLAGNYNQEWIRYNNTAGTGTPAFDQQIGPTPFIPNTPTEISVTSGSAGMTYIVDFTNNNGVLSNFSVSFPSSGTGSASAGGITITGGPTIILADPVNKKFTFNFTYNNSAGAGRNITDKFY